MTIEQIRDFHERRPFKRFRMVLADGTRALVRSPQFLAHPGRGRTVVVFDRGEHFHVIDLLLVAGLEVGHEATTNGNGHSRRKRRE